ncbi:uncharacterized protein LOC131213621 [Anopheles bellator]|uniref:uncharacterized protein LOC131213621 n=1 Tax=Anopheles bellator TaxID=139047 RepID=UPI00264951A4|nr:uncharacterized protein LOC131213621 [Anopheles bellator]
MLARLGYGFAALAGYLLLALTTSTWLPLHHHGCEASPVLLDKLFGFAAYQPSYSGGGYGGNQYYGGYYGTGGGEGGYAGVQRPATAASTSHKRQAKGRNYKDICRVVNPAPYASPGRAPYPAAPFCPY